MTRYAGAFADLSRYHLSQLANPVRALGDAVLYRVPGTFAQDFVLAKVARDASCLPWIVVVHEMKV